MAGICRASDACIWWSDHPFLIQPVDMENPIKKEFIQALREVIREEAVQNRSVRMEGLGRFETVHEEQVQKRMENGDLMMLPPKESLRLVPEKDRRS